VGLVGRRAGQPDVGGVPGPALYSTKCIKDIAVRLVNYYLLSRKPRVQLLPSE
jgi:hypothetical protein